jgi:hypothetical protein
MPDDAHVDPGGYAKWTLPLLVKVAAAISEM